MCRSLPKKKRAPRLFPPVSDPAARGAPGGCGGPRHAQEGAKSSAAGFSSPKSGVGFFVVGSLGTVVLPPKLQVNQPHTMRNLRLVSFVPYLVVFRACTVAPSFFLSFFLSFFFFTGTPTGELSAATFLGERGLLDTSGWPGLGDKHTMTTWRCPISGQATWLGSCLGRNPWSMFGNITGFGEQMRGPGAQQTGVSHAWCTSRIDKASNLGKVVFVLGGVTHEDFFWDPLFRSEGRKRPHVASVLLFHLEPHRGPFKRKMLQTRT